MNIVVNRKNLLDALRFGGMVAGKNKTIPILDYCKVSIRGEKMVVTSTDTEVTIAKKVSIVKSDVEHADFCIMPSDLTTILATLKQEMVELRVDENTCTLNHARGTAKVSVLPAMDFPTPSPIDNKVTFSMNAARLANWFDASKNFVGSSQLRPALSGMFLSISEGEVFACASDSTKLYMDSYKDVSLYGMSHSMIIPSKVFSYASGMLSGYEDVMVQADDNSVSFIVHDAKISTRLIVGAYPKVRDLMPKTFPICVELNTEEFKDSISRMKLFADQKSKLMELSFGESEVKMTCADILFNKSCEDSCDVLMYSGEPIEVCAKTENLDFILSRIESETVMIGLSNSRSPIVIYEANNKDKVLFTMPLLKAQ